MRTPILLSLLAGSALIGANAHAQGVSVAMQITVQSDTQQSASSMSMKMKMHLGPIQVVAWLTPLGSSANTARPGKTSQTFTLTQKNKQFSPHLLVIPTGASVNFPNLDPFFHNVFSLFNGRRFDLGLYEAGSRRSVRFDHDGVSYIFCNIHPEMGAVVVSLSTPYYTVSNRQGAVLLENVPPGEYELNLWSENVRPSDLAAAKQRVRIGTQELRLRPVTLTQTASSLDNHLNKFGDAYKAPGSAPY